MPARMASNTWRSWRRIRWWRLRCRKTTPCGRGSVRKLLAPGLQASGNIELPLFVICADSGASGFGQRTEHLCDSRTWRVRQDPEPQRVGKPVRALHQMQHAKGIGIERLVMQGDNV